MRLFSRFSALGCSAKKNKKKTARQAHTVRPPHFSTISQSQQPSKTLELSYEVHTTSITSILSEGIVEVEVGKYFLKRVENIEWAFIAFSDDV